MKNMKKEVSKKISLLPSAGVPAKIPVPSPHVIHVPPVYITPQKFSNNLVVSRISLVTITAL